MNKEVIVFDRQLAEWAFCPVALWVRYFGDNSLTNNALMSVQRGFDLHGVSNFHDEFAIDYGLVDSYAENNTDVISQLHYLEDEIEGKPEGVVGIDDLVLASKRLNLVSYPDRIDYRGEMGWVVVSRRFSLFDPFMESIRLMLASAVVPLREHKFPIRYAVVESNKDFKLFDFEAKSISRRLLELENLENAVRCVKRILTTKEIPSLRMGQCGICGYENCPSRGEIEGVMKGSKNGVYNVEM